MKASRGEKKRPFELTEIHWEARLLPGGLPEAEQSRVVDAIRKKVSTFRLSARSLSTLAVSWAQGSDDFLEIALDSPGPEGFRLLFSADRLTLWKDVTGIRCRPADVLERSSQLLNAIANEVTGISDFQNRLVRAGLQIKHSRNSQEDEMEQLPPDLTAGDILKRVLATKESSSKMFVRCETRVLSILSRPAVVTVEVERETDNRPRIDTAVYLETSENDIPDTKWCLDIVGLHNKYLEPHVIRPLHAWLG